jgi:3-oxoacyl-[acyl-carrier-protein] synthase-3
MRIEEIDFCLFHSGNLRLLEYLLGKLNISLEKTFSNIQEIGNTGSASIGIALSETLDKTLIKPESVLLLAGIGAGFNFAASLWKM